MAETTDVRPAVFQSIPIDQIRPATHQARKAFDEASIQALAESIKQEGLLQPITIRQVGEQYELISGERRLRAAKLLGWPAIDAKIIQTVSEAEAAAKGLVENLQREDLNPIEEAEGFAEINRLDSGYWTQAKIGQVTGRSESFVSRSLDLLKLPDPIKDDLRARKLSRSHGLEFLRLDTQEKQLNVAKQVLDKKLNWEATRELVDQMLGKPEKPKEDKPAKEWQDGFRLSRKGGRLAISGNFPANTTTDVLWEKLMAAFNVLPPLEKGK